MAHHKDGDWSTTQRKCRPITCGWRNGQCCCIQGFLRAQQWKQQYPDQFAGFVKLNYPVNDTGCRQKCLDRKLARISSYTLFFHTSGAISAYNDKQGQLKEQHVLYWEQSLISKLLLNSENSEIKFHNAEALTLSCSMHLRYADSISKHSISVTGEGLHAMSVCCMFSGLLLPSPRSRAILLLVLLTLLLDYTLLARAPELYLWSGTCLGEEASSKQAWLLVVSSVNKITFTGRSCVW